MRIQSNGTPVHRSIAPTPPCRRYARLHAPALIVLIALLVATGACRRKGPIPWPELEGTVQAAGAGIEARARFLPSGEEIERLFKWHMPDSGVVPVQVSLRNNDVVPLTVYCWSDIVRDESFKGFSLLVDGEEVLPLHPIAVLQRMAGTDKHISYSRSHSKKIVAGTFLPPLGGYFLYREFKVGWYYRPLFKHSFYESLPSGLLVPRTLEPGETARGYIYLILADEVNPYPVAADSSGGEAAASSDASPERGEVAGGDGASPTAAPVTRGEDAGERAVGTPITLHNRYELVLESYRAPSFTDSLPVYDAFFPRRRFPAAPHHAGAVTRKGSGPGTDEGFVLALHEPRDGTGGVLFGFGRVDELTDSFDESFHVVTPLSGTHARIADAAMRGSQVVCALNFTGKSRIYLFDTADHSPRPGRNVLLPRKTKRLYLSGDTVLVVTDDEFCRVLSLPDLEEERYVRLGHAVKGVTLCGDRLVVLDGMRGVCVYGAAGETLLGEIERHDLRKCGDLEIAACDPESGAMMILYRGSRGAGDTLAVCSIEGDEGLHERARLPLPAPVTAFHGCGLDLMLHLDGGLLLRFDLAIVARDDAAGDVSGVDLLRDAAYIPVRMSAMMLDDARLTGIAGNGVLVRGTLAEFAPRSADAWISRCTVKVLEVPPEQ